MLNQRRFDFSRRKTMTGNVDHVVHASSDPIVPFMIASRAIPGKLSFNCQYCFKRR
jgi:hypothetical protein